MGSGRRSHFVDLPPSAWPGLVSLFNPSSLLSVLIRARLAGRLLTACFGCCPTYTFLIGPTASPSEVHKVETASEETLKNKNKNIWHLAISNCDTCFLFFFHFIYPPCRPRHSQFETCKESLRASSSGPDNFLRTRPLSSTGSADQHLSRSQCCRSSVFVVLVTISICPRTRFNY